MSHVSWRRPGGAELLDDVSFSVGDGDRTALVGANGVGKTTLLRLISGEYDGHRGTITIDGRIGVLRQLVGRQGDPTSVRGLLVSLASPAVRIAGTALLSAEAALQLHPDDPTVATAYAAGHRRLGRGRRLRGRGGVGRVRDASHR